VKCGRPEMQVAYFVTQLRWKINLLVLLVSDASCFFWQKLTENEMNKKRIKICTYHLEEERYPMLLEA